MQASVPELMDIARRDGATTLELYGCQPGDGSFASNCLLARRLAERGVRFIQLYHKDWDHHGGVKDGVELKAEEIDRACMALITDLKQRGHARRHADRLGRRVRPHADVAGRQRPRPPQQGVHDVAGRRRHQGRHGLRRDRRPGYAAVEKVATVHDLHATMLHLLGIDHNAFSVKFQGLDARLSGVEGAQVLREILA